MEYKEETWTENKEYEYLYLGYSGWGHNITCSQRKGKMVTLQVHSCKKNSSVICFFFFLNRNIS